jgi:subtilisin family serine protease
MNGGLTGTRRRLLQIAGAFAGSTVGASASAGARHRDGDGSGTGVGELVLGIEGSTDVRSVLSDIKRAMPTGAAIVCRDDELRCLTVAHSNVSTPAEYDRYARLYERHDWCAYAEPNLLHYPMVVEAEEVDHPGGGSDTSGRRRDRSRGRRGSRGRAFGSSSHETRGWRGRGRFDEDDEGERGWRGRGRFDEDDEDERGWRGRDRFGDDDRRRSGSETGSLLDSQYAPQVVNAPEAWETTLGDTDVTIAVIDTGIDHTHETLAAQFGDPIGIDFLSDQRSPVVPATSSHGTSVAGLAAATTSNETGIAGISNAQLLSVRALAGAGKADRIAMAIRWAAKRADIINMSFATDLPSQTLRRACAYAAARDTLLVAPAGNKSRREDLGPEGSRGVAYPTGSRGAVYPTGSRGVVYPTGSRGAVYPTGSRGVVYPTGSRGAVYPTGSRGVVYPTDDDAAGAYPAGFDTVLSVSAIDRAERPADFTLGGDSVDLTAPGAKVLSTARNDTYARVSGTSMSAPIASGAAALAKSIDPRLSADDLEALLKSTARPLGIDPDVEGSGCVDTAALVDRLRR